jgi:pyruvate/2-oxoglutarate dehydrogenase complex dihydrolipoamide acyltransferase (E2) component
MSVADAKRALKACEEGIETAKAIYKSNQALIDERNKVDIPAYKAKHDVWKAKKAVHDAKYIKWDSKSDEYAGWKNIVGSISTTFNKSLGWWNDCRDKKETDETNKQCAWEAENVHNLYHPSGFYAYASFLTAGTGPCHWFDVKCRRTQASIDKINLEYNAVKPTFTDDEPTLEPAKQLNTTNITIACCANTLNVIGSNLTYTDIEQQNNCLTNQKQQITDAEKAAAEKEAAEKAAALEKEAAAQRQALEKMKMEIEEARRAILEKIQIEKEAAEKAAAEKAAAEKAAAEKAAAEKAAAERAAAEKEAAERAAAEKEAAERAAADDLLLSDYNYDYIPDEYEYSEQQPTDLLTQLFNKPYLKEALLIIVIIIILVLYFR